MNNLFRYLQMRLRYTAVVLSCLFLLVGMSGCHKTHHFKLRGQVQSADGTPLSGVSVMVERHGTNLLTVPVVTAANGSFSADFRVVTNEAKGGDEASFHVLLSKEGYVNKTLRYGPIMHDIGSREASGVPFTVQMQKSDQPKELEAIVQQRQIKPNMFPKLPVDFEPIQVEKQMDDKGPRYQAVLTWKLTGND